MKRHNGRIVAVLALYNMDVCQLNKEETLKSLDNILEMEKNEEYPVDIDDKYARHLILGIIENLEIIDKVIENNLTNYTLDRLSYVDRSIIRVATYEMKFDGMASGIVINEALEITKDYSSIDDKQVKFNNRVLEQISKNFE